MRRLTTILLIAPFRTATPAERSYIEGIKATIVDKGMVPIFLPHAMGGILDDEDPGDRALALRLSAMFVATMAQLPEVEAWRLGDRLTEGMALDVAAWEVAGRDPPKRL